MSFYQAIAWQRALVEPTIDGRGRVRTLLYATVILVHPKDLSYLGRGGHGSRCLQVHLLYRWRLQCFNTCCCCCLSASRQERIRQVVSSISSTTAASAHAVLTICAAFAGIPATAFTAAANASASTDYGHHGVDQPRHTTSCSVIWRPCTAAPN